MKLNKPSCYTPVLIIVIIVIGLYIAIFHGDSYTEKFQNNETSITAQADVGGVNNDGTGDGGADDGEANQKVEINSENVGINTELDSPTLIILDVKSNQVSIGWVMPKNHTLKPVDFEISIIEIGTGTPLLSDSYTKPHPNCPRCNLTINNLDKNKIYSVSVGIIYQLPNKNLTKTPLSKPLEVSIKNIVPNKFIKLLRKNMQKNRHYNEALNNQKRQNQRIKKITQDIKNLSQKIHKIQNTPSTKKYLHSGNYIQNYTQLPVKNFINPDIAETDTSVVRVSDTHTIIS